MVGLGPRDVSQTTKNYSVSGCHMLNCNNGNLCLEDGSSKTYFSGRIYAPSTVGVQLDSNGDVFFIVNGVKHAKAFSVPVEERTYHLLVSLCYNGDQVMLC